MEDARKIVWICGAAAVVLAVAGLVFAMGNGRERDEEMDVVIGTYGEHLYRYGIDTESLDFTLKGKVQARNASYALMERGPEGWEIFSVSETGAESGACSFVSDGRSGDSIRQTAYRQQTGADPCFVMIHEQEGERFMLTADYSGGSISVFPIRDNKIEERIQQLAFSGSGPVISRQEASHIHQLKVLPETDGIQDSYILATDLGADAIRLLYVGTTGSKTKGKELMLTHMKDIPCPAGSGPRHMEFSKDGRIMYCIAELSGEVLAYDITEEDGIPQFSLRQRIQADEVNAGGSADIHIHPSGKWLYTSHRLDNDGIAIFRILDDGTLEKTGYQRTARHPRNFMISPDGCLLLVACRDDRLVQVFRINEDGSLTLAPAVLRFEEDMPSSITLQE